jgi:hypothetical protein
MFDSIFLLTARNIWKERNNVTFGRGSVRNTPELFHALVAEAEDWMGAGFATLAVPLALWSPISNFM